MKKPTLMLLVLALLLIACGGGDGKEEEKKSEAAPIGAMEGDASKGEKLFKETLIGSQPGCITCHSLEPGVTLVGPSQAGVGSRATTRVSGMSAEEYLRQSILEPEAFLVDGFAAGMMPAGLVGELSGEQVNDLVAFMLTLK